MNGHREVEVEVEEEEEEEEEASLRQMMDRRLSLPQPCFGQEGWPRY